MHTKHYFAVDLGATSGRTILGKVGGESIELRELTRFPNVLIEMNGHVYWDIYALYWEIIKGLQQVAREGIEISSVGIDTWGVDFVFFGRDGELLGQPYAYRDPHTTDAPERFFREMSRKTLYGRTGIQIMNFNSLFQLYTLKQNHSSLLAAADKVLFMPDALSYLLTGEMVTEYTIASTSQLLNPETHRFDPELLQMLGLQTSHFGRMVMPGTHIGCLSPEVRKLTGLGAVPVIAVAGHDTASAVAAVPCEDESVAYLSSGTWSLMGIEASRPIMTDESYRLNFTNEGGLDGSIRFLKNICGMWLLEQCRREWAAEGQEYAYGELIDASLAVPTFHSLINPDAPEFANPDSMIRAIQAYCAETGQAVPRTYGEITRCIFDSLALRYKEVFGYLQQFAKAPLTKLHVIGGGSRNNLLNRFTSNALGVPVVAGPSEATAIGNIMLQAKADQMVADVAEMRRMIRRSVEVTEIQPKEQEKWEEGYRKYQEIVKLKAPAKANA